VTITLQLTNSGYGELRNVAVQDVLPEDLLLQSVSVYSASAEILGQRFIINVPSLAGGQTLVIVVSAIVSSHSRMGRTIEHQPVVIVSEVEYPWPPLVLVLPPALFPATGRSGSIPCAYLQPHIHLA